MRMDENCRSESFMEHAMGAWGPMAYRLALSQTRSTCDADDVVQDVFLKLLKDGTRFRSDEHLKAWLIRVTINRCRELHRSAWRRRVFATDSDDPAFANLEAPEQELFASETWAAVGQLPEHLRLIVHLHYYEGYSLEDIARMLDCKPTTIRTRLHRARKRLKLDLEQEAEREAIELGRVSLADERR